MINLFQKDDLNKKTKIILLTDFFPFIAEQTIKTIAISIF